MKAAVDESRDSVKTKKGKCEMEEIRKYDKILKENVKKGKV